MGAGLHKLKDIKHLTHINRFAKRFQLEDLSIDEMVCCFGCCQAHLGLPDGFILLRYSVESLSLLYLHFLSSLMEMRHS